MSNQPQSVTLTIMSKEYRIACEPEEQDGLVQSAQQLDAQMRKMRDSGKISGAERIAVMAALNMSHELQVVKKQNAELSQHLQECLANINRKMENVLENP